MPRVHAEFILQSLIELTQQGALASFSWLGKGEKEKADQAAVEAMHRVLKNFSFGVEVAIGEGVKDKAPVLPVGTRSDFFESTDAYDLAVDPIEGTTNLANGVPSSFSVAALAEYGQMFNATNILYVDKMVLPAEAQGIDPDLPIDEILWQLAKNLEKQIKDLRIQVLNRPRNRHIVEAARAYNCRVDLLEHGDVQAGILAMLPGSGVDGAFGIGGAPEGVIVACAARALGACCWVRCAPQSKQEEYNMVQEGFNQDDWISTEELVGTGVCYFAISGITSSDIVEGVQRNGQHFSVSSLGCSTKLPGIHRYTFTT